MATNKDISILQGSTFSLPVRWMNGDQIIRKPITAISVASGAPRLTVFGVLMNDLALIVGMFFALMTFVLNWYYKYQELKVIERRVIQQTEAEKHE